MTYEKLAQQLAATPPLEPPELWEVARPSAVEFAGRINVVRNAAEAEKMVSILSRLPVSFVAMSAVFRQQYDAGLGIEEDGWQDPTSLRPVALGLAAVVRQPDAKMASVRVVFDVRRPDVLPGLACILEMPLTVVAHFFKAAYFAMRCLKLPTPSPSRVACTWLASQMLALGKFHQGHEGTGECIADDIRAEEDARLRRHEHSTLAALARRHGVSFVLPCSEAEVRRRLAHLADEEELPEQIVSAVAAEAHAVAALHSHVSLALIEEGLEGHYAIELPAAVALAEIEMQGTTIDRSALARGQAAAVAAITRLEERLVEHGFQPGSVGSDAEKERVLGALGLLERFRSGSAPGEHSFRQDVLKEHREAHPVVELLYLHAKASRLATDGFMQGKFIGSDGRAHPWTHPLGADTGRPSFRWPNLPSVGKVMRPAAVPDGPGLGLVELDYVAQEVFIAAAAFGDEVLLADCNNGDPYIAMVRVFCAAELADGEAELPEGELARKRRDLRDRVKVLVLGITYGMGDESFAEKARTSVPAAKEMKRQFFRRYSQLAKGMERAIRQLQERGYVQTVTGLRRHRGRTGKLSRRETRWAVNAIVQGGGACVLKLLLPRLDECLRQHGGRVVLPIFDAVLIEAPLATLPEVAEGARRIMVDTMRELFPGTMPRVEVNMSDPSCWNKNGRSDSIERFAEDPEFKP